MLTPYLTHRKQKALQVIKLQGFNFR